MLHKKVAKPHQIIAFTFTDRAAEELKFRVRSKIQELLGKQPDIGDMYIGTIHAFAFKIIQDFIPKYRAYDMLDEVRRLAFLSSIKRDIDFDYLFNSLNTRYPWNYYKHGDKQNWAYRTFIKDIDLFREEGLTDNAILSDSFKNAYKIYLQKLEEKRFLDFSGILGIAVNTLENEPRVRKKLHSNCLNMAKNAKIEGQGTEMIIYKDNNEGFISLTDIARYRDTDRSDYILQNWMRNLNTRIRRTLGTVQ